MKEKQKCLYQRSLSFKNSYEGYGIVEGIHGIETINSLTKFFHLMAYQYSACSFSFIPDADTPFEANIPEFEDVSTCKAEAITLPDHFVLGFIGVFLLDIAVFVDNIVNGVDTHGTAKSK